MEPRVNYGACARAASARFTSLRILAHATCSLRATQIVGGREANTWMLGFGVDVCDEPTET